MQIPPTAHEIDTYPGVPRFAHWHASRAAITFTLSFTSPWFNDQLSAGNKAIDERWKLPRYKLNSSVVYVHSDERCGSNLQYSRPGNWSLCCLDSDVRLEGIDGNVLLNRKSLHRVRKIILLSVHFSVLQFCSSRFHRTFRSDIRKCFFHRSLSCFTVGSRLFL